MFIVYNKSDLRVVHFLGKKPVSVSNNLGVAECSNIPQGDFSYYTVVNIDGVLNPTCNLLGHIEPKVDKRTRNQKISALIREKYSQDEVEAILSNYLKYLENTEDKQEKWLTEYQEFQSYRAECKSKIPE